MDAHVGVCVFPETDDNEGIEAKVVVAVDGTVEDVDGVPVRNKLVGDVLP